jgi:SAM-dependent methyltransferase
MTQYDDNFFDYVNSGALQSAKAILPILQAQLKIDSVLDVGCGQGAWLAIWKQLGVSTVHGIDGDYVARDRLLIEPDEFTAVNLVEAFDLGRKFDLVQSLEVGEHLPESASADFVASIVKHGQVILFSSAAKGQGGDHHINEQDYEFWRAHFARHDYLPIDALRPQILDHPEIEPWYRYNSILYVERSYLEQCTGAFFEQGIDPATPIPDLSPALYQLRKKLVRLLPIKVATQIAKIKEARTVKKRAGSRISNR